MNCFKPLDLIFPCGKDRHFGEVVGVQIHFLLDGSELANIDWERKAWYVNASVNAFHMHRGLIRDFDRLTAARQIPKRLHRPLKRLVVLAILNAYLLNYRDGAQWSCYTIDLSTDRAARPSLWWVDANPVDVNDSRELLWLLPSFTTLDLAVLVAHEVSAFRALLERIRQEKQRVRLALENEDF